MMKPLLILVGLAVAAYSNYSANNAIDGLLSDFVAFTVPTSNYGSLSSTAYQYNFKTALANSPTVAFGIWNANFVSSMTDPFDQFAITVKSVSASSIDFDFKYKLGVWRSVKIGFLANLLPELKVGTSSIDLGSLRASNSAKLVEIPNIANYQKAIARVFLNGFALNAGSQGIQTQIEARTVQANGIYVAVATGSQTDLKSVSFSYLVFSPTSVGFASYGGMVSRNGFSGVGYQDVRNSIHLPNYFLQGLVKLSSPLSLNFASTLDNDFVFGFKQEGSNIDFVVSGVVFGISPRLICQNNPDKYAFDAGCVAACPSNTFAFAYKDGGLGCRRCSSKLNLVYNSNKKQCVCAVGFEMVNGTCVRAQGVTKSAVEEFASLGVVRTGNDVSSISQNPNSVRTVTNTNTGAVITISGSAGVDGSQNTQPIITAAPIYGPTANGPSTSNNGGITILPSPNNSIANSYVPTVPSQLQPSSPPIQPTPSYPSDSPNIPPLIAENAQNARSCANLANTYWTGYRCSCRVGYRLELVSGLCLKIGLSTPTIITPPYNPNYPPNDPNHGQGQCRANEVYTYGQCVCINGYTRDDRNNCILNVVCAENSYLENGVCVCRPGHTMQSGRCIPNQNNQCPANMYFNGVSCVCNPGYELDSSGRCNFGNFCPPNSQRNQNGVCQCLSGFIEIRPGVCSQCENGAVIIGGVCTYTCGVNEQYNAQARRCECKPNFGYTDGVCGPCRQNFFLISGYCVTCPVYASYNPTTNSCQCANGYVLTSGLCVSRCRPNQIFDAVANICKCASGLALLPSGECGLCPNGQTIDPATNQCTSSTQCPLNQIYSGGICVCQAGYGMTPSGCVLCSSINAFVVSGYCVTCPPGKVWRGTACVCPEGQTELNGVCSYRCNSNQLADSNGNCFYCPVNEEAVGGVCVCKSGLTRDPSTNFCRAPPCPSNSILINGLCGICVMGTVPNYQLQACVCANGYYLNSLGFCEMRVVPPVQCNSGFYPGATGCLPCGRNCATCQSATVCQTCIDPFFIVSGGECIYGNTRACGNGVVEAGEQCDDRNSQNGDGCSAYCTIENRYQCWGNPSACFLIPVSLCGNGRPDYGERCDDNNTRSGDGCSSNCIVEENYTCTPAVIGRPSICTRLNISSTGFSAPAVVIMNINAVYTILTVSTAFNFASEQEMTTFMKYSIPDAFKPSSGYCRQRATDLRIFECLFNYPYGIPKTSYTIQFSYSKDGLSGFLPVYIDVRKSQIGSRSLN